MKNVQIYAIYDSKTEAYSQPFFAPTDGAALRMFEQTVNDNSTQVSKYPADYTLFNLGEYNDASGQITGSSSPKNLGNGLQYKKEQ